MIFVWRNKSELIDDSQGQVETTGKTWFDVNNLGATEGKKEFNIELKATVSVHLKVKMEKIRTPLEQPGATS